MRLLNKLFFLTLLFCSASPLNAESSPKQKRLTYTPLKNSLATIPEEPQSLGEFKHATDIAFSHDSRLITLLQSNNPGTNKKLSGQIDVWNTHTGDLKYSTGAFEFDTTGGPAYLGMRFSPENTMLAVDGIVNAPMLTWKFTQTKQVQTSCIGGMLGHVDTIDDSNQTYTMSTDDGLFQLCNPGAGELLGFHHDGTGYLNKDKGGPGLWWGKNLKILHNNKLLVLYNIRQKLEQLHIPKGQPDKDTLKWLVPWNMDYSSSAEHMISLVDRKQKQFILIESFNDKVTINQWNYAKKSWINKQSFPGVKVDKNSYGWSDTSPSGNAYLSEQHLLLRSENQFSLFKRMEDKLTLLWTKQIAGSPHTQPFSLDGKHLILYNNAKDEGNNAFIMLVSTIDGSTQHYSSQETYPSSSFSTLIDPQAEYFVESFSGKEGCPPNKNSRMYSLPDNKKVKEIDGAVLAMSPDGNFLAVCKDKELFLLRNQVQ